MKKLGIILVIIGLSLGLAGCSFLEDLLNPITTDPTEETTEPTLEETYNIVIEDTPGGSVTVENLEVAAGETVIITVQIEEGYLLDSIVVSSATGAVTVTDLTFSMPETDVVIEASFVLEVVETYSITILDTLHGEIVIASEVLEYEAGEEVVVSVIPDTGYRYKVGSLKYNDGTNITQIIDFRFLMPDKDITLTANFEMGRTFRIDVSSNVEEASVLVVGEGPYAESQEYSILAEGLEGYDFLHWKDTLTGLIVSFEEEYQFTLRRNSSFEAIYVATTDAYLFLYSTLDSVTFPSPLTFTLGEEVSVTAEEIEGYEFQSWVNYSTDTVLSTEDTYAFTITESLYVIAVYQIPGEESVLFSESFDTASKVAYAESIITVNDKSWNLSEALIGQLADDKKEGLKSIRMRTNGVVETKFESVGVTKISFMVGNFGTTIDGSLEVDISFDAENWILKESFMSSSAFTLKEILLDSTFYSTHGKTLADAIYFRIRFTSGDRINIDTISFTTSSVEVLPYPQIEAEEQELEFPNESGRIQISFDENFKTAFSYGETYSSEGCTATDIYLGEMECEVYGYVDTSELGEYEVIYYVQDIDGLYASRVVNQVVLKDAALLEIDYVGYYDGLEGLYGEELLLELRSIINANLTRRSYDEARQILADSDVDPMDSTKVLTIYSRDSVTRVWDAESWHREHVWPNSRLGVERVDGSDRNIASDLHNLRAIVPSINSSRSNKVFSSTTTSSTYYPGDLDKGDVARIMFYMVTMYEELTLVNDILPNDPATNYTLAGAYMSIFDLFITWHCLDTVDSYEENRNDVLHTAQGNRNPFIDYPHFVELIWFSHENIPLS